MSFEMTQQGYGGTITDNTVLFGAATGMIDSAPDTFAAVIVYDYIRGKTDQLYVRIQDFENLEADALLKDGGHWDGEGRRARNFADGVDDQDLVTFKQLADAVSGAGLDPELAAIAGLTSAADKGIVFTGAGMAATFDLTAYGRQLGGYANEAAFKAGVNLEIGVDVQAYAANLTAWASEDPGDYYTASEVNAELATYQPLDATLTALAGVTVAANQFIYATGSDAFAAADFTAVARTLVAQSSQANMRTVGLGLSANGSTLVVAADYAAMRGLLDLEPGTDFYSISAANAAIAAGVGGLAADLASTATGEGAALIGIEDAGSYFTATDVEAALQYLGGAIAGLSGAVVLKGDWAANAGTFPGSGAAVAGWSYIVSTAGTVDSVAFSVGDRLLAITDNASTSTYAGNWLKLDYTDQVTSVAGRTGAVTLAQADISGLTTAASPQFAGLNVGHASDSTITRVSAGVLAIEGSNILTADQVGVSVQAYSANLAGWSGEDPDSYYDAGEVDVEISTAVSALSSVYQPLSAALVSIAGLAVTDGNIIVGNGLTWGAESGSTARASLGLAIGTDVQAYSATLASLASASANGVSLVTAADYAAMRGLLDLEIGTDVQAYSANLAGWASEDPDAYYTASEVNAELAAYQPVNALLTDIAALTDPNADRILFWDDSEGEFTWLTVGTGLSISGTTLTATGGGGGGMAALVDDATPQLGGDLDTAGFDIGFNDGGAITDDSDNEQLVFVKVASAVNYIAVRNAATGGVPRLVATGDDTNVNLELGGKGTGGVIATFTANGLQVWDSDASHALTITTSSNLSAARSLTIVTGDSDRTLSIGANSSISGTAYVASGTDVALADGGTGASLADPGADRVMFWDDSEGAVTWLTIGSGLSLTGTTLTATGGGGGISSLVEDTSPQLGGNLDLNSFVITGLEIGTDVQAYSTNLADWSALDPDDYVTATDLGTALGSYLPLSGGTLSGNLNLADGQLIRPAILDYGVVVNAIGSAGGGTQDIDVASGNAVSVTVDTSATTFTFSNPPTTGVEGKITVYLTNGGSQTVNWPASVRWAAGTAPTLTASGIDILVFSTIDGGTTWFGFVAALDMQAAA